MSSRKSSKRSSRSITGIPATLLKNTSSATTTLFKAITPNVYADKKSIGSLFLSLGISIAALVLISLAYTHFVEETESKHYAFIALIFGAVALGAQFLGTFKVVREMGLSPMAILALYIVAGVLALVATLNNAPIGTTEEIYALVAGLLYILIAGSLWNIVF